MTSGRVEAVRDGVGSALLRVEDVATTAADLVAGIGAELIGGEDDFRATVASRLDQLADRVTAHTALELMARRDDATPASSHVVNDIAGLRSLVDGLRTADALVSASTEHVRSRSSVALGLVVHPTSISDAAADVFAAREAVAAFIRPDSAFLVS